MTIDEAIKHCLEVAEQNDFEKRIYDELNRSGDEEYRNNCEQCAADHRQLAEWLTELKELRKLKVINPIIAGYNEVYEKLIKGDIEESKGKDLLKTAVDTLENVMPKYRRLSEENQKQKEQIAEYKRLLKAAVEDFRFLESHSEDEEGNCLINYNGLKIDCKICPLNNAGICDPKIVCRWNHEAEAIALIGKDIDVPATLDDTNVGRKRRIENA